MVAASNGLAGQQLPRPSEFGFRRVHLVNAVVTVVIAAIIYYVVTDIYALVFNLHGKDKLPSELSNTHNHAAIVMTAVFVCAVAPMCEEFFSGGFLFGTLRKMHVTVAGRDLSVFIAAVITGILFGLVHTGSASSQYLIPLGFLGFMLCMVRWRTGSLYPCMAMHSANNAVALGYSDLHWTALEILALIARLVDGDRARRRADRGERAATGAWARDCSLSQRHGFCSVGARVQSESAIQTAAP